MHRRSVPRAIAIGLGVGILVPVMHMMLAALLSIPTRANIALAAAVTVLINPVTIPPIYLAAWRIGEWELEARGSNPTLPATQLQGHVETWLSWAQHASAPLALGIVTLAIITAVTGYALGSIAWRWHIAKRWKARRR